MGHHPRQAARRMSSEVDLWPEDPQSTSGGTPEVRRAPAQRTGTERHAQGRARPSGGQRKEPHAARTPSGADQAIALCVRRHRGRGRGPRLLSQGLAGRQRARASGRQDGIASAPPVPARLPLACVQYASCINGTCQRQRHAGGISSEAGQAPGQSKRDPTASHERRSSKAAAHPCPEQKGTGSRRKGKREGRRSAESGGDGA